ncbi:MULTISPECIES: hypothetical protein [unclassified Leucobacter]|uniref:hypothetical protein n=1 Tax=unclassified Leucobacter TaxID=2621730 RepID=UPI0030169EB3
MSKIRATATLAALLITIPVAGCSTAAEPHQEQSAPAAENTTTPAPATTQPPNLEEMTLDELLGEFAAQKEQPRAVQVLEIVAQLIKTSDTECTPTLQGEQLTTLLETKAAADAATIELGNGAAPKTKGPEFYLAWAPYAMLIDGLCGPASQ